MLKENRKILFIRNPISGGRKSASLHKTLETIVKTIPGAELVNTSYPGHARELAAAASQNSRELAAAASKNSPELAAAASKNAPELAAASSKNSRELAAAAAREAFDVVVAVGGDGTVNEVASALVGTDTALGIVPLGSGNGLARHLRIPLQPEQAIKTILEATPVTIDSATINGRPYFCASGVGFDAQVAADYAKAGTRGLVTYAKEAIKDWLSYKPGEYAIETEDGTLRTSALLITIGNANQWGNDYFITPEASLRDGKLDVAIVKPASIISNLKMVWQLRHKTLTHNPDVRYLKTSFIKIQCLQDSVAAHYDGEVANLPSEITVECKKDSLKILPGKTY